AVRTFDQQAIALSPAAKQAKQRDLQQLQQRFEQRNSELQDKAQQRQRELLQPIQARVTGVIQGIRAEGNYQLIFDADAPGVIVLCKPDLVEPGSAGPGCRVLVRDPHVALLSIIPVLYPEPAWEAGVHRTAIVGAGAVWQEPVAIGPYAVLGRGVRLGKNARI